MSEWNSAAAVAALDRLAGTAREVLSLNVFGDTQDVRKRLEAFESDLRRSLRLAAQEVTRLEGVVRTQRDSQDIKRCERNLARTIGELGEAQEVIASLTEERDRLSKALYETQDYLDGPVLRIIADRLSKLRKRGLWHLEGMMA